MHPAAAFGDVVHVDEQRYHEIRDRCAACHAPHADRAMHVHVGMPDAGRAIRALNGLRAHLPAAAGARGELAVLVRPGLGLRDRAGADVPRLPAVGDPARVPRLRRLRGDDRRDGRGRRAPDYTFLWWDVRPHPLLGTVEVRAMDAQSRLRSVAGLAALIHGLALALHDGRAGPPRPAPAGVDGVVPRRARRARGDAGRRRTAPVPEVAAGRSVARAGARERRRPRRARRDRADPAEGNGADRRRAAFERGGMRAVLGATRRRDRAALSVGA